MLEDICGSSYIRQESQDEEEEEIRLVQEREDLNRKPILSLSRPVPAAYAWWTYVFPSLTPHKTPQDVLTTADATIAWASILFLMNWLRHFYHDYKRAGSMCLWALYRNLSTSCTGLLPPGHKPVTTLISANKHFGLGDTLMVLPLCVECCKIIRLEAYWYFRIQYYGNYRVPRVQYVR